MEHQQRTTGHLEVTSTLGVAFDRAIRMMFKPFDFGKWFVLGLIIFLESLIEGGGGSGAGNLFNRLGGSGGSGGEFPGPDEIVRRVEEAVLWLEDNLSLVLAIGIPGLVLLALIVIVILWLGCRGQMMFIRAVALDDDRLGDHWRATKLCAGSLLKFRLALAGINLVLSIASIGSLAAIVWRLLRKGSTDFGEYLLQTLPIACLVLAAFVVLGLVDSMLRNFVAPLMYKFGEDCTVAWKRFGTIAKANVGPVIVFLVMRFCFGVGAAILAVLVVLLTCCVGALPVVHQALMSPYYVFDRAWSLYALGGLGPEFELMRERPAQPSPPTAL